MPEAFYLTRQNQDSQLLHAEIVTLEQPMDRVIVVFPPSPKINFHAFMLHVWPQDPYIFIV